MLVPVFKSLFSGDPMGVPSLNACTLKNSSFYVCNNAVDSPELYVHYDGVNGPDDGHEWLVGHPFY
ncbi:hypothetical protein GUITHDRAFT_151059 [Guillardia theta CCMP2712]|uniref:Uncharacterized protein n=1 Tax=Guillardia theta (strain CCMP2712) TaxID=905079 RepID=L1JR01_GUITC|nr:hypothetical protein GUITHDRAFT_151059 [Guillardia theta CCMP2712]EKX50714.1 hypothetical protein GUITHDRAFT_151059 [Guillardia theta CCMP2712]|eukprot:XP_005837694.1 hypothetical protein GUITHDRAFT_151059 [Guillardia theta CCMP2712]